MYYLRGPGAKLRSSKNLLFVFLPPSTQQRKKLISKTHASQCISGLNDENNEKFTQTITKISVTRIITKTWSEIIVYNSTSIIVTRLPKISWRTYPFCLQPIFWMLLLEQWSGVGKNLFSYSMRLVMLYPMTYLSNSLLWNLDTIAPRPLILF